MAGVTRRRFLWATAGLLAAHGSGPRRGLADDTEEAADRPDWHRKQGHALGTTVTLTVVDADPARAGRAMDEAFAELERVESVMSLYRPDSELVRLNAQQELAEPHPYLCFVLRAACQMAQRSNGAFDPTVQPLWQLYASARDQGGLPSAEAINDALKSVDWRGVHLGRQHVAFDRAGMQVTLNGIAQGFAADRVLFALRQHGIRQALIDTGELGALGYKPAAETSEPTASDNDAPVIERLVDGGEPDRSHWTVGIQHPRRPDAYIALVRLDGRCLATSGDYATRFTEDARYNHLLDPRTGRSPAFYSSVSVMAPTGMLADALSTALFVMDPQSGAQLVRSMPGADALFVLKDGSIRATTGFPRVS